VVIYWSPSLGVYSATHPYSVSDQVTTFMAFMLFALPSFWIGTLVLSFCVAAISSTSFLPADDLGGVLVTWPFWQRPVGSAGTYACRAGHVLRGLRWPLPLYAQ